MYNVGQRVEFILVVRDVQSEIFRVFPGSGDIINVYDNNGYDIRSITVIPWTRDNLPEFYLPLCRELQKYSESQTVVEYVHVRSLTF